MDRVATRPLWESPSSAVTSAVAEHRCGKTEKCLLFVVCCVLFVACCLLFLSVAGATWSLRFVATALTFSFACFTPKFEFTYFFIVARVETT